MAYQKVSPPANGQAIQAHNGVLKVPNKPIIPRIAGDGIGPDISRAVDIVVSAAVNKAYGGEREIVWFDVFAGESAMGLYNHPLPPDTLQAIRDFTVAIKGPLTTPVGGGIRSLNVAFRLELDLYACVRPVRYFEGVPAPVKHPEKVNVVIYRENTEDTYSGIEFKEGTPEAKKLIDFINGIYAAAGEKKSIRADSGIGAKHISSFGTKRLVRKALRHAVDRKLPSMTLVHKGNIMKFTEGAFRDWGYDLAREEFRANIVTEDEHSVLTMLKANPSLDAAGAAKAVMDKGWGDLKVADVETYMKLQPTHGGDKLASKVLVKDRIADNMFQQILLRPDEYSVLALPNLNGDYMSDAAAAQVGGLGMAPGANIGDTMALFEATHGTAPKYADLDKVNPSALLLSAVMMLDYIGWDEAARSIENAMEKTIQQRTVTYDLARMMDKANEVSCSGFGKAIAANL